MCHARRHPCRWIVLQAQVRCIENTYKSASPPSTLHTAVGYKFFVRLVTYRRRGFHIVHHLQDWKSLIISDNGKLTFHIISWVTFWKHFLFFLNVRRAQGCRKLSLSTVYGSTPLLQRLAAGNEIWLIFGWFLFNPFSVSVFLSTLVKPGFRLEMLVGSCTAWSMEFSLMVRCRATKPSAEEMIPSTRFSAKLERENTFLALCLSIWNPP